MIMKKVYDDLIIINLYKNVECQTYFPEVGQSSSTEVNQD